MCFERHTNAMFGGQCLAMLSFSTSARKLWMTWVTLGGGLALLVLPLAMDLRVAWVCLFTGAIFTLGALAALVVNPSWGSEVDDGTVTIWHEPKKLRRTISVSELKAVHVLREADVAQLELGTRSISVPRACVNDDAVAWAQALHARFPQVELHVD